MKLGLLARNVNAAARVLRGAWGTVKAVRWLRTLLLVLAVLILPRVETACTRQQAQADLATVATVAQDTVTASQYACLLQGHIPFLSPAQEAEADVALLVACDVPMVLGQGALAFVHDVQRFIDAGGAKAVAKAQADVVDAREVLAALTDAGGEWHPPAACDGGKAGVCRP